MQNDSVLVFTRARALQPCFLIKHQTKNVQLLCTTPILESVLNLRGHTVWVSHAFARLLNANLPADKCGWHFFKATWTRWSRVNSTHSCRPCSWHMASWRMQQYQHGCCKRWCDRCVVWAAILLSKSNDFFLGDCDPTNNIFPIKISNFQGDLTDALAKTKTLCVSASCRDADVTAGYKEHVPARMCMVTMCMVTPNIAGQSLKHTVWPLNVRTR